MANRFARLALAALLLAPAATLAARQTSQAPAKPSASGQSPKALAPAPETPAARQANFIVVADQVLAQMSRLIDLPILHPLKQSLRSKAQIRSYLVAGDKEDKDAAKRHADKLALEAFGLIPRGFALHAFMLNLLTEQIAGYYDPKAREFYIADWIPIADQRMVMAHELTHALQDQHFHIDKWLKAARPNDDAMAARQAVLEGSAVVSMFEYELRGSGVDVRRMPDLAPLTELAMGAASSSPGMDKAPPYIRDSLLFPYLNGAVFTQQVVKAGDGWPDFYKVFARPPVSTQQIMQPSFYLEGKAPPPVTLPDLGHLLGKHWKLLDQNIIGEFGLQEILRQYLPAAQVKQFTPDWWGDRYAILENKKSQSSLLVLRLRLDSPEHAAEFFTAYGKLLRKKHATASHVFTTGEFLQFDSAHGGVFFDCRADECLSMEGAGRPSFDKVVKDMHWPQPPQPPAPAASTAAAVPPRQTRFPAPAPSLPRLSSAPRLP